jgi:geranylgeranyl diphosphate synthase, type I
MVTRLERIEKQLQALLPEQPDAGWVSRTAGENIPEPSLEDYRTFCLPAYDLVQRGGKRWRPLLMVLSAESAGGIEAAEHAYPLTPVVEFPHTGSLIIDDIEDSSEWRRGERAVHTVYGTDISINAGNLLYFLPTVSLEAVKVPEKVQISLYRIYSRYMRRVHLGQGLDICWHRNPTSYPRVSDYLQMCRFKTGCLAGMSAEMGTAVAGWSLERTGFWGSTAEKIGLGFQIRDDVENLSSGNPGKRRGDDIVENKKSLPVILHIEACPEDKQEMTALFTAAAGKGIDGASAEIEAATTLLGKSDALGRAGEMGDRMLREALEETERTFAPSEARDELLAMISRFID